VTERLPTGKQADKALEQARKAPLASPALGTAVTDLVAPCAESRPLPAPPPPATGVPLALAFSGGGFRASLAALGVLRFVADSGLLGRVRYVSSVSGGSVAHGLLARHYDELEREEFRPEALDRVVINPFIDRISRHSLIWALLLNVWKIIGPKTRTQLLADTFADWFYGQRRLDELSPSCRFVFNAADLTTGVRFGFERDVFGDYVLGRRVTDGSTLRLADAVAASAAFPGAFAPLVLGNYDFPCRDGRVPRLLDGGAYDNLGLEAVDDVSRAVEDHPRRSCLRLTPAGCSTQAASAGCRSSATWSGSTRCSTASRRRCACARWSDASRPSSERGARDSRFRTGAASAFSSALRRPSRHQTRSGSMAGLKMMSCGSSSPSSKRRSHASRQSSVDSSFTVAGG
jgi:predicted acylesterase/phospholipase RssA